MARFPKLCFAILLMLLPDIGRAERLALERFGLEHGLPSEHVTAIAPDSRGFVWIGTNKGLSRFDGAEFRNYTMRDGLPDEIITAIAEDAAGSIWVGTNQGLARIDQNAPRGRSFQRIGGALPRDASINALAVSRDGVVWVACGKSLFRLDPRHHGLVSQRELTLEVDAIYGLAATEQGELWIATSHGLWRRFPTGRLIRYSLDKTPGDDEVRSVGLTADGVVWLSSRGILLFKPDDGSDPRPLRARVSAATDVAAGEPFRRPLKPGEVVRCVSSRNGMPEGLKAGPVITPDGTIWAASSFALARFRRSEWSLLGDESGVAFDELLTIAVDRTGAIWLGTLSDGLLRLRPRGLVSYSSGDGLLHKRVTQLFELRGGELVVASWANSALQALDGLRFRGIRIGAGLHDWGWGWNQVIVADRDGDVWVATGEKLFRYRHIRVLDDFASSVPIRYGKADGLGGDNIFRVWEDRSGDLWIATFGDIRLSRYDRSTHRFVRYASDVLHPHGAVTSFAQDARGDIWIGWYDGGVTRFRDGAFRYFDEHDGFPPGFIHALMIDSRGALLIASSRGGVGVIDRPGDEQPVCHRIDQRQGLASNNARALVEGLDGAIWVGSERGIDRIDRGGTILHFDRNDGLANNLVTTAYRDRDGVIWFGTVEGVSAFPSMPATPRLPRRTLITRVVVDGAPMRAPDFGSMAISGLTLGAATRRIEIGFVAPFLQQTRSVRYAYRMIGVDDAWTETTERLARFERLPAAALRFEVRAITSDGTTTPPASVEFMVASPIWRRWWFIAGVIATLAAVLLVLHRQRVASLLAVERMRTTIATDLHDDLGSSLSRMSILTEVARRQVADTPAAGILDDIGDSARSLIGALGDSIWAIDPRIDNLQSLVARTRHHASGMLEAAGINSRFQVQEGLQSVHLAPSDRRQLYLIIKEAVSNVVRHSSAKNVHVFISSAADGLHIDVIDDGHGFEPGASMVHESGTGGRGTASMRARAEALGGTMKVTSKRGEGTRLSVAVPLRHSAFPHLRSR